MDMHPSPNSCGSTVITSDQDDDLRRGPWTVEEDIILMNYIGVHGEGRWNSLARSAGLKRTGKSCRLRWLNYLRPDVRRGNITPEEQLLILELHSRWGNRWSKIAQHLPGRTDNEIKNYWRTRVQKHAKQLRCDVNSKQFKDIMRYLWMPRLVERIHASSGGSAAAAAYQNATTAAAYPNSTPIQSKEAVQVKLSPETSSNTGESSMESLEMHFASTPVSESFGGSYTHENSTEEYMVGSYCGGENWLQESQQVGAGWPESTPSPVGVSMPEFELAGGWGESLWSVEDIWLQQQF